MKRNHLWLCLAVILVASSFAASQVATGTPPFSSMASGPFDVINLGNLNVHFAIPIVVKAGRGMPFTYNLSYDSSIWAPVSVNGSLTWQPVNSGSWGWKGQTEAAIGYISFSTGTYQCIDPNGPLPPHQQYITDTVYSSYAYHDYFGVTHRFPSSVAVDVGGCGDGATGITGTTTDGSGYSITANGATGNKITS